MTKAIYFDMDGTIADLYGVDGWLPMLRASDPSPYKMAKPLINLSILARYLNKLQRNGYKIGIVSWLSKCSDSAYDKAVTLAKTEWLAHHLASVNFDEIVIVPYGTPKSSVVDFPKGILFDDEKPNRTEWNGTAHDAHNIIEILKGLV
jgi:histidinol phosphatase-like enzyme